MGSSAKSEPARLAAWRRQIVTGLLRVVLATSAPLLVLTPEFYRRGAIALAFSAPFIWAAMAVAAFTRARPTLRARVLVYGTALVALLTLPSAGPTGGASAFVVVATVSAVLLLGEREARAMLAVVLAGFIGWWIAVRFGVVPRPLVENTDIGDPRISGRVIFVLCGVVPPIAIATGYLIRRISDALRESEGLVEKLRVEIEAREEESRRREAAERQLFDSQKLEALGRLAGGVAHDVNNNLQVAITNAELMKLRAPKPDEVVRLASDVQSACETAASLTRQLLTVGRRDLSRPTRVVPATSLEKLGRNVALVAKGRVKTRFVVADDVPDVFVDANQLEQVLLNLAINACDAIHGEGELTLELEHRGTAPTYDFVSSPIEPHDPVRIHVRDTGTGIPRDRLRQIFEPFFTTKEVGRGTGLGLALALAFVERNDGRIGVRTAPDKGSTFTLELPALPPLADSSTSRPLPTQFDGAAILVVDDDPRVLAIEEWVLREAGYEVLVASDVPSALEIVERRRHIDLLCTDAVMPGEDGEALVAQFRKLRPSTPVLVCSGYVGSPALRGFIERGHFAVVTKPFSPEELRRGVAEALAGSEAEIARGA